MTSSLNSLELPQMNLFPGQAPSLRCTHHPSTEQGFSRIWAQDWSWDEMFTLPVHHRPLFPLGNLPWAGRAWKNLQKPYLSHTPLRLYVYWCAKVHVLRGGVSGCCTRSFQMYDKCMCIKLIVSSGQTPFRTEGRGLGHGYKAVCRPTLWSAYQS